MRIWNQWLLCNETDWTRPASSDMRYLRITEHAEVADEFITSKTQV